MKEFEIGMKIDMKVGRSFFGLEHRVEIREHHSCGHPTCNRREHVWIIQNDYLY